MATTLARYGKEIVGVADGAKAGYDLYQDIKEVLTGQVVNKANAERNVLADKELENWSEKVREIKSFGYSTCSKLMDFNEKRPN